MSSRGYAPDSRQEGHTASSQGFGKREQAEEGAYMKRKEQETLQKMREQLAKTEQENADLKKKLDEAKKK